MAYTPTYDEADLEPIAFDLIGSVGAKIVLWIGLIVVTAVVGFLLFRWKRMGVKV